MGLSSWEQYTIGFGPEGKFALMKFCLSFSLLKVNVGLVFRVTNTLFALTLVVPNW